MPGITASPARCWSGFPRSRSVKRMDSTTGSDHPVVPQPSAFDRADEMNRRGHVTEGLRGILAVLNSNRSLEEILDYIVGEARRLLGADAAAIYRLMPDK